MRRSSLFLTLCTMLVLSFGLVNAQNRIYISSEDRGYAGVDTVKTNYPVKWTIAFQVAAGDAVNGSNNGFIVFSPDGATFGAPVLDTLLLTGPAAPGWKTRYDGGVFPYASVFNDGAGAIAAADTVGIGGFSISGPGFGSGFNFPVVTITIPGVPDANDGLHICLDSSGYQVNSEWLWSAADTKPDWSGQKCYTAHLVPNQAPNITNCQASFNLNHCSPASYQFTASDPDALGARPLTFIKNSGPGTVSLSGLWNYSPTLADVGTSQSLSVSAQDDPGNLGPACVIALNFTNACPTFTSGCGATINVGKGNSINHDFNANSNDCDPISFFVANTSPAPTNNPTINPASGLLNFQSDVSEGGASFTVTVGVTDTKCTTTCNITINVLSVEPYEVQIEKTHNTIQGGHELVCVTLNKGSEQIWGFDFLIAYDQSALSFVGAIPGDIYDECGWEYFNYRYGANGNCSGGCPSGLIRVVGLAETNNGPNHPDCYLPSTLPVELFCLDFLVTNDRTFECMYAPIRFFWVDCGDNTISYNPSDDPTGFVQALAVSREIHEFDGVGGNMANGSTGFPTYYGAQDECLVGGGDGKPAPIRFVDFINGGVDIVCADSIDARGDINLNGLSNEVADAVLFTNYFVYGMGVFTVNPAGQIAATDVNADGLALSVADLVYLIRIVIGDALPYPKLAPVETILNNQGGVLSIADVQVGAASIVLSGRVEPTLLASNMMLEFAYDGANNVTRALVVSPIIGATSSQSFTGSFLNIGNANIVGIEMATAEGAPIVAKEVELPTSFALNQNYPNPFNPKTRISFALPTASDYTLTIYNVTGQKVTEFTGSAQAGNVEIDVDASTYSSGVYFYKLIADKGKFTDTKKMVLVK